jgi:queuosine precursor transporter
MAESHAVGWSPTRRDAVFLVLAGVFITHALLGEVVGGKLVEIGGWTMSVGVIPWPVVFVTTDLVNEYYGPRAVRRLTLLAVVLIAYAFLVLYLCMGVSASGISPVSDAAFAEVFGQSMWIIVGSIIAFAVSQLLDAGVFGLVRSRTGERLLWARALGSTVVSQLVDTFVINAIAFGLPGKITAAQVIELSVTNYAYKFLIAIATVPVIYAGHGLVSRYLARDE